MVKMIFNFSLSLSLWYKDARQDNVLSLYYLVYQVSTSVVNVFCDELQNFWIKW